MAVIQIETPTTPKNTKKLAIFELGFRPFFIFGCLFAIISIFIWLAILFSPHDVFHPFVTPTWWHAHEMLFGFSAAIIAGFLLTAIQNWTGIPGIKNIPLVLVWILWLIPRIFLLNDNWLALEVVAIIDLAFFPIVALIILRDIILVKQWRNLMVCIILFGLFTLNLANYLAIYYGEIVLSLHILDASMLLVVLLVAVIGTRVIPFFTERATTWQRPLLNKMIPFKIGLVFLVLSIISLIIDSPMALRVTTMISGVALLLHWNKMGWRASFKNPLLWSLHLAYFCIPLGLLLIALGYPFSAALHCLTIGSIAGMILAMIARISLGHTGRMIQTVPLMPFAFALIFGATLLRVLAELADKYYPFLISASGLLFILAFIIYLYKYLFILLKPRADGKPG